MRILAKIETIEALHNFEELVTAADGVIICRIDIGLDLPPEKLMIAQKWMINKANKLGKPCFISSQILDSMVNGTECTRLEIEEISSAVFEGVDSIILSHETSIGKHPIEAVTTLSKGIAEAENVVDHFEAYNEVRNESLSSMTCVDALCTTACAIALENVSSSRLLTKT